MSKLESEMGHDMDSSLLRRLSPRELALHLRQASEKQPARRLSTHLLKEVELETLPPTIFDVFLTSVGPPCPLKDALWQRHSKHTRHAAIRQFGKNLKSVYWEDAWQEVGGTEGLLDLFAQLSVLEAENLSLVIGRCPGRSAVKNGIERQRRVTELVQCLMCPLYPSSPFKSKDQRPLHGCYARMLPACTSDFVESILRQQSHPLLESVSRKGLVRDQFKLLSRLVVGVISQDESLNGAAARRVLDYVPLLLQSAPSIPAVEPHLSASMSLAMTILEKITLDSEVRFPESIFMPQLMVPLMRRLKTHRLDPSRVRQILQLTIKYLQRHEHARTKLSPAKGNLIYYVAKHWSRAAPLFKECLADLIGLLRGGSRKGLYYYQDLIHQVARPQRYELLKIICLHNTNLRSDIDSDAGLKTIPIESWPIFIFQMLQRDHSLSLLQRMLRLKPEANFLELGSRRTILSQPKLPNSRFGNPRLLLGILQPGNNGVELEAQRYISETLEPKASKSREQTDRAFFAKSAAFHAIASGSMKLYGDVVQWTRRFSRDVMTVKTVYSSAVTCTTEGIALLGGIPEDLNLWKLVDIRMRIINANAIMLSFLDTAVASLREPSFHDPDWFGPLSLFQEVVASRMSNAGRLKGYFKLSEDDIYDILWPETIVMLLQSEETGLEHEALGFNFPIGPLGFRQNIGHVPALRSTYRFLDNLARSRDALWKRSRPTMDPAVAALKPPWPLGLPIQCLMGSVNIAVDSAYKQTPFMTSRAAEIVMIDPAIAFVDVINDKEMRGAVGQFIDSFNVALDIYVMQCPPGSERDSRVYAAWSHAVNALSNGRLSENEAKLFWRNIFKTAIPQRSLPGSETDINKEYPVIPTDVDPREPFEWSSADLVPPEVELRELAVTVLDCMIATPHWLPRDTKNDFQVPNPKTQAVVPASIWSLERLDKFRKLPAPVQEGMIATTLLVGSSKIEGSSRMLASPFPSESNVRYPSMFLDHDFLLSGDAMYTSADVALSHFIKMVPSTLLLDLTASAIDALSRTPSDSTKFASIERTAYKYVMLLSKSDRPHLASNLIVRIVLDHPDASSWHRQLLSQSFVRNLSAGQAQSIITLFASSILEGLEQQQTSSRNQQDSVSNNPSNRYIKITTVKFLAQILDDANFVSPGFSVDVLSKLFQTASHIDIRVAVLNSMLSILGRCGDDASNALVEKLMSALEMAIPALSSLNERRQAQDADWTKAEKTGKLPEVYGDGGMQTFPPMLDVMLRAVTIHGIPSETLRTAFIRRILLPVIEKSKEESARWVKMFTLKHLPAIQPIHTPSFPVRPGILAYLIQVCPREVPKYILDLYQQFFLTNISPPARLVELNNKLTGNIELCESNEGQFWLSLYGNGADIPTNAAVGMLTKPWKSSTISDGLQISHVQDLAFEQAEAILKLPDESFGKWNTFMGPLGPPVTQYHSEQDRSAWLANSKPVLVRIIERIDALRTPAWQRDRNRQPAVLPPTLALRLWLLDYPQLYKSSSVAETCATFAQQIVSLLQESLDLGLAHHARLAGIQSATLNCLPEYRVRVACRLGNFIAPDDPTKPQEKLLRAELADALLRNAGLPSHDTDDETLQSIKAMLEAWRGCELEDVRMRGFRLGRLLLRQIG